MHLIVPDGHAAAAPVLFYWHGWGSGPERSLPLAAELGAGAVVVVPQGLPRRFDGLGRQARDGFQTRSDELDGRDVKLFDAVLAWLDKNRCGDLLRVASTGFSNGGFMSHLLGCVRAERLVAVAAVGGAGPGKQEHCGPAVPTLGVHGKSDRIVPFARFAKSRDHARARHGCHESHCKVPLEAMVHPRGHIYPAAARARVAGFLQTHWSAR